MEWPIYNFTDQYLAEVFWRNARCGTKKCYQNGFDLTTRDLYFTILVEVFTNHILKHIFHESFSVNRAQGYGRRTCKQVQNYSTMS